MTLPGETEAGSAGMQPCRGIAWWAHRDDVAGRGSSPFALCPKPYRIGRPLCLENPRPEGAEYSLTESAPSPFHAEPEQNQQMGPHVHLHCLVPAGGLSADRSQWIRIRYPRFFLPGKVLGARFRRTFLALRS